MWCFRWSCSWSSRRWDDKVRIIRSWCTILLVLYWVMICGSFHLSQHLLSLLLNVLCFLFFHISCLSVCVLPLIFGFLGFSGMWIKLLCILHLWQVAITFCCESISDNRDIQLEQHQLFYGHYTLCISRHLQLTTARFCSFKVLLPACLCWWQLAHSD